MEHVNPEILPKKRTRPAKELSAEEIVDALIQTAKKRGRLSKAKSTLDGEDEDEPIAPRKRGRMSRTGEEVTGPPEGDVNTTEEGTKNATDVIPEDAGMDDPMQEDLPTIEPTPSEQITSLSNIIQMPARDTAVTATPGPERAFVSPSVSQTSRPEEQNVTDLYLTLSMDVHGDVPHEESSSTLRTAPVASVPIPPLQSPTHHETIAVYPSGLEQDAVPIDPILLADVPNHTRLVHDPLIAVSIIGPL